MLSNSVLYLFISKTMADHTIVAMISPSDEAEKMTGNGSTVKLTKENGNDNEQLNNEDKQENIDSSEKTPGNFSGITR